MSRTSLIYTHIFIVQLDGAEKEQDIVARALGTECEPDFYEQARMPV